MVNAIRNNFVLVLLALVFLMGFAYAGSYYVGQVIGDLDGAGEYNGQKMSVKILGIVSSGPYAETYSLRVVLYDKDSNVVDQAFVEPGTNLRDVFFDSAGNYALKSALEINEINLNVAETPKAGAEEDNEQQGEVVDQNTSDEGQEIENEGTAEDGNVVNEPQYCEDGTHKIWESWKVECNTCGCGNDGVIKCTKMKCSAQEQVDENQAGQENAREQAEGAGIIESIMQFFQGLLKLIFV